MSNLGFEDDDPAQPGNPENWILVGTWSPTTAQFDATVGLTPQETFEEGWGADGYLDDPPVSSFVAASFGVTIVETFEDGWGATPYKTEPPIGTVEVATFSTDADFDETFEKEWGATPYLTAPPVGFTEAVFTLSTGNSVFETFEEWDAPTPPAYLNAPPTTSIIVAKFRRKPRVSGTFAVDVPTNVLTYTTVQALELIVGDELTFSTTNTLPDPLISDTIFYVLTTPSANTITISATSGGSELDIIDVGVGVHSYEHLFQYEDFESVEVEQQVVVDPGTDVFTIAGTLPADFAVGDLVSIRTTGQAPSPINPAYIYVIEATNIVDEFRLKPTQLAAAVDITDSGVGQHFVEFDKGEFWTSVNDSV